MARKKEVDINLSAVNEKLLISVREAAALSGLSINRIERMVAEEDCPFVVTVGSRTRRIRRLDFIKFIQENDKF